MPYFSRSQMFFHAPYPMLLASQDLLESYRMNVEIFFDGQCLDTYQRDDIHVLKRCLDDQQLICTIHGPFHDLNPGSKDARIRHITRDRYWQTLDVAALLEAKNVVFHTGYIPEIYDRSRTQWIETALEVWQKVLRLAKDYNLQLSIENTIEHDFDVHVALLDALNTDHLGICFDIGHANCYCKGDIRDIIDGLPRRIVEIHISDNDGHLDRHWVVGQGNVPFHEFFEALKMRNIEPLITFEAHSLKDIQSTIKYIEAHQWVA